MRATEFMTSPVVTVRPETPIATAGSLLLQRDITAAPVVDGHEHLVGIVSSVDLLRGRVVPDPRAHLRPEPEESGEPPHTVGDVMTRKVVALQATADESDFCRAMLENRVKSIPVVSDDRLVGIVSVSDLLRTHVRTDDQIAADVRALLRDYAGGQDRWAVDVTDGVVSLAGPTSATERRVAVLLAESVPGAVRVRTGPGPERAPRPEPTDHRGLRVFSYDECLERLRTASVGRLAFVYDGGPTVLPVNHGLDGADVVFRTTWGSKLHVSEDSGPVAFEVDGYDQNLETGWSVLVKGTMSVVYDEADTERYERLGVRGWAGLGEPSFWVRIRPEEITGRGITG
ncbi:MAG TPA: CBS domain-containing protein [Actinomycetes bacterium]